MEILKDPRRDPGWAGRGWWRNFMPIKKKKYFAKSFKGKPIESFNWQNSFDSEATNRYLRIEKWDLRLKSGHWNRPGNRSSDMGRF